MGLTCFSKCGRDFSLMSVRMGPTARLTTRMSVSASSSRSESQCASRANFVALYAMRMGKTTLPRMELHCTILPRPPLARNASTARTVRSCHPKKLHSKISRSAATGTSSVAPPMPYAPLLKRASSLPSVSLRTCAIPDAIVFGFV